MRISSFNLLEKAVIFVEVGVKAGDLAAFKIIDNLEPNLNTR